MKICIVVDNLNPNVGWGRLALKISDEFKKNGHKVGFVVEKRPQGISDQNLVVPLRLSLENILRLPKTLLAIRGFINTYDVVLCYDVNPNGIILNLANLGQKKKIVIHALGTYSLFGHGTSVRNFFMRWSYRRAKKILVISEFTKREIEKSDFKLDGAVIIPVGVDIDYFYPDSSGEKILPYPFILTVAAFKNRKGHHFTIPAFSLIAKEFPDLKYVVIGDKSLWPYYKKIEDMVEDMNLKDRVVFMNKVGDEDLLRYYRDAKLYVQTSATETDSIEGFGMVYLEASACGIPTIGAYNTGAEAAIKNNETGILVKHDPKDIADAMRKILTDENFASKLGSNGIKWAEKFNWSSVASTYLENM
ncbi:MAG: hypothetical protein COV31_00150 [Candidatus Yanofskybacteria bacterium CG10_big_fil_rev_8_21_14_0_10_46_23]|uniref:Glycosyl transferase family 1 domain-containing protein n=1 Tax=Candidatus Yanofskybacteria bacterium CG10_big_fil_rev_8_21_14_0_10_46_23 TaxID=1975098 RepID=A0A2H0R550_9BACT|nr:MAG: hypothetical protein COV31_00150 [Candidatus Yanofskybacteria bacterium CG10_big_fil_rev_8_21_14_0_10_46_23]